MAFNFNWSPLTADSLFYSRAKELLTAALNKSPKPPIIVDDILVNELNLGSIPPELEILEIGDLAEDRFRGIFKMCYSGDAFLTLKTRVQANPLNTYLSTKPSFTSPQPLAASSGLTIPLQITLSEIKLSAFIILVFSKQKGVTLVFRNDPLESLKVSSTFDSIPFVRDYLQEEIEGQLRVLLMEEVPAIIHRLSLRLWVSEYRASEDERERAANTLGAREPIDPLVSPPHTVVDSSGNILDVAGMSPLSLDSTSSDSQPLFSQKNLLRLAALTDRQRSLSLFTPSIKDAVFRAWAGTSERGDVPGANTPVTPALTRTHSAINSTSSIYGFSNTSGSMPSRPPLISPGSTTGLGLGSNRHSRAHAGRKKKTRVVNLRRKNLGSDTESTSGESTSTTSSVTPTADVPDVPLPPKILEERDEDIVTPPRSPNSKVRFRDRQEGGSPPPNSRSLTPARVIESCRKVVDIGTQTPPEFSLPEAGSSSELEKARYPLPRLSRPSHESHHLHPHLQEKSPLTSTFGAPSNPSLHYPTPLLQSIEAASAGILERALVMKMAGEIARRSQDEKSADGGFWAGNERDSPPPAYEAR
ncbi:MAG: ERMES complex subunit [Geoglossum umbratile]|nr:MAG: ERMES complex subunit [Geoglossum umbratile]